MRYPIIDAHQHFWKYNLQTHNWITDEMHILRRDFFPPDLEPVLKKNNVSGSVLVQVEGSEKDNEFMLKLANQHAFIKGVVGWIDFQTNGLDERLQKYQQYSGLKGFRHLLQGEKQRNSMLQPGFKNGIGMLNKYGFTYDLLILPDQLEFAYELVRSFPDQRFVIDHLAKPGIKQGEFSSWNVDMKRFAACRNVYCKLSGMVTEADWENWETEDFIPYVDAIVEIFGMKRVMFGSDWPVCLTAGTYEEVKEIADDYFSAFSETEQSDFFGGNATDFYNLS
jgi:L-fuconolactonase